MTDECTRGDRAEPLAAVIRALAFAAERHRDQRRKGSEASPAINHIIEVVDLLVRVGGVRDPVTLEAAVLHDTLEDTRTSADEIDRLFGEEVRGVVLEVTDDKGLSTDERKRLQVERAARLSPRAREIRIADKISNVRAVATLPPASWPLQRRLGYIDWSERVVHACGPGTPALRDTFARAARESRAILEALDP